MKKFLGLIFLILLWSNIGIAEIILLECKYLDGEIRRFKNKGIPTVSLFISGRPMIVDKEINYSDSFISIWLPGTAVEGINDVIFSNLDGSVNYDFNGKLSFSWPDTDSSNPLNLGDKNYSPKFKYGYGLKYKYLNE